MPTKPEYQRIFDSIRDRILSGELAPGDRIPTKLQLRAQFRCSMQPVERAIQMLQAAGLIIGRQGKGNFVAGGPDTDEDDARP